MTAAALPAWAEWADTAPYSVGVEEEVMLLSPDEWSLAQQVDRVIPALEPGLAHHVTTETHRCVVELATDAHEEIPPAMEQLAWLRHRLEVGLVTLGLRAASAGTHPFAVWQETLVSGGERYEQVYGSMRELARREPTFALHVHVGVPEPQRAIHLVNCLRAHLPLFLAVSANSPFWQGRDSGLASARTPLFQAFPRVGIPRRFESYEDWVGTVDLLLRCDAFPEPNFLWWDVRPQPRFGTVEVRILDAQTTVAESAALAALVQSVARLELEEGFTTKEVVRSQEVLEENRFIAARDGLDARLIDPRSERRVPARLQLRELIDACRSHAAVLGCAAELASIERLFERGGAERQVALARGPARLPGLVAELADSFCKGEVAAESAGSPAALAR